MVNTGDTIVATENLRKAVLDATQLSDEMTSKVSTLQKDREWFYTKIPILVFVVFSVCFVLWPMTGTSKNADKMSIYAFLNGYLALANSFAPSIFSCIYHWVERRTTKQSEPLQKVIKAANQMKKIGSALHKIITVLDIGVGIGVPENISGGVLDRHLDDFRVGYPRIPVFPP